MAKDERKEFIGSPDNKGKQTTPPKEAAELPGRGKTHESLRRAPLPATRGPSRRKSPTPLAITAARGKKPEGIRQEVRRYGYS